MAAEQARKSARVGPSVPGEDVEALQRMYLGLAPDTPEQVRVTAFRAALDILRPVLSRIWLDTKPTNGSWPAEVRDHSDRLTDMIAAQPASVPRRPGMSADTLSLDPADQASFALASEAGPFAAAVSAMSRDGKLVCETSADQWRLRLTPIEQAELGRRLATMAPGPWLICLLEPRRSRVGAVADPPWPAAIALMFVALSLISRGLDGLHHPHPDLHTTFAMGSLLIGSAGVALNAVTLTRAAHRFLTRRRSDNPAR